MKALLIYKDNGEHYDSFQEWVESVYLVPDDFNRDNLFNKIKQEAKQNKLVRTRKDGEIFYFDYSKIYKLFDEYLNKNYEKLEIIENE